MTEISKANDVYQNEETNLLDLRHFPYQKPETPMNNPVDFVVIYHHSF